MARSTVDHYIPFFGRDFLAATAGWTAEERGHYVVALIVQWEQGSIPDSLDRLEMVSRGISQAWDVLEPKFPVCQDGRRRNPRMEAHRAKCEALKEARAEAGREGGSKTQANRKQTGEQTASKPQANGQANDQAKVKPPTPTPTPSPDTNSSPKTNEENSHTHTACGDDFRQPGWAADEWARFAAAWNQTPRAARWEPLIAPSAWVEYAASPGWQERARAALERLPGCEFFQTPLAVTKFFEFVDRILAGEFDRAKQDARRVRQRTGGNL